MMHDAPHVHRVHILLHNQISDSARCVCMMPMHLICTQYTFCCITKYQILQDTCVYLRARTHVRAKSQMYTKAQFYTNAYCVPHSIQFCYHHTLQFCYKNLAVSISIQCCDFILMQALPTLKAHGAAAAAARCWDDSNKCCSDHLWMAIHLYLPARLVGDDGSGEAWAASMSLAQWQESSDFALFVCLKIAEK